MVRKGLVAIAMLAAAGVTAAADDVFDQVEHGYADNNGVKIHYASIGEGPLIVMIHGFPDFWYSWRHQMAALKDEFQCVAIDLRGYNRSDKPEGEENYDMAVLVSDVVAVIKHLGHEKAIICGHDWGGAVAWGVAMFRPDVVDKLIICNLPHPYNMARELATNEQQKQNSQYARSFQQDGAEAMLSAEMLAGMIAKDDEVVKARYVAAFEQSDFKAMLNYYRRNYPREPYTMPEAPPAKVKAPVLMFHGLKDRALLPGGLNGTWDHLEQDLTLVTVPDAEHWVHHDAPGLVSSTMRWWLKQRAE